MAVDSFSSPSEKEIIYAQIQKEIDVLKEQIRVWHSRHNELNITARLPHELLGQVFLWVSLVENGELEHTEKDYHPTVELSSFRIASVCQGWRQVALDCPLLWNRFNNAKHVEWLTQVVLPRSKHSLLSIHTPLRHPAQDKRWEGVHTLLHDHSHRLQEMSLTCKNYGECRPCILGNLLSGLSDPMVSLQTLVLSVCSSAKIPCGTLERMAPNLKSLTLVNFECEMVDELPPALQIESLTLDTCTDTSMIHFALLMVAFPNLQELTIKSNCGDLRRSTSGLTLKELKRLTIHENLFHGVKILSLLSLPCLSDLKITASYYEFTEQSREMFLMCVPVVKFFTLNISCTDDEKQVIISVILGGLRLSKRPAPAHFVFPSPRYNAIPALFKALPLDYLETLEISTPIAANLLLLHFSNLAALHTINIVEYEYEAVSDFAYAYGYAGKDSGDVHEWYEEIRDGILNAQTIDVDAHHKHLSKVKARFLSRVETPLRFKALKRLNIASLTEQGISRLGAALLLRHSLGIPLEELHVHRIESSCDARDVVMIRQSMDTCVGSIASPDFV